MTSTQRSGPPETRIAALDGIRGLAIAAVVIFHLWPAAAPGGFVGVSVFFTLSGYVITRSLLRERSATGHVDLAAFWGRRARRLLPASLATLVAILALWSVTGWATRDTGADLLAALGQVANWRFIAVGQQYGASHDSPVAHFWSLAIEEQFYLVVPLVFLVLGRRRLALAGLLTTVAAAGLVLTWTWANSPTVVYYATPTRATEIAAGCLLALRTSRAPTAAPEATPRRPAWCRADIAGMAGLGVVIWAAFFTSLADDFWYRGALGAVSLPSIGLILAATAGGRVARVLETRPLVALGTISYSAYLVHWPIDVALRNTAVGSDLRPWLSLVATVVVAGLSHRLLEAPVMAGQIPVRRLAPAAAFTALAVATAAITVSVRAPVTSGIDFAAAQDDLAALASLRDDRGPAEAGMPVRAAVFGDSTALMLGFGLIDNSEDLVYATGYTDLGCPIGRGGRMRGDITVPESFSRPPVPFPDRCDWSVHWPDVLQRAGAVDVAVILVGNWDLVDREVPGLDGWRRIGDPDYDRWLADEIRAAVQLLSDSGVREVVWLTLPSPAGGPALPAVDRFNAIVDEVVASSSATRTLDYAGHLASSGDDALMRPDRTHLTQETARTVARRWLIPLLVGIARL